MRRWTLLIGAAAMLLAACRPDTVRISFQPAAGAVYRYEVRVRAETRSTLAGAAPRRPPVDDFVMHAEHRVVAVRAAPIPKSRSSSTSPTWASGRSRRASTAAPNSISIQSIEGVPAEALGRVGLSEILPGAARRAARRPLVQATAGRSTRRRT